MTKIDKKTEIIDIGTELIALNGYNATGIDTILKQAGVPKGSFYHYFRSKEDFGLAVIDRFAIQYEQKLGSFFDDSSVSPLSRIRNYLEHSLAHMTENHFTKGCLIGNLGQELADQNERFREKLAVIFQEWKERFSSCLTEAQKAGEISSNFHPDIVADFILAGWEGAILRSKVTKSPESLRNFIDTLFKVVLRGS